MFLNYQKYEQSTQECRSAKSRLVSCCVDRSINVNIPEQKVKLEINSLSITRYLIANKK